MSGGLALTACSPKQASFKAVDITGVNYAKDFSLLDPSGQRVTLASFAGKVVVLFLGYTQCPDVCPTTMTELLEVKRLLGARADKLQVVFVSLDPERDTPAVLQAYMANFDPSFVALSGSAEQLQTMAQDFKAYFKKVPGQSPGSYTLDHSAASYVYDPQGRLRLYARYGMGAAALAEDLTQLLNGK